MEPGKLANLLGVTTNTIRRYSKVFKNYLTPTAAPQKGKPRFYSHFDQRVILFISQQKRLGNSEEKIITQLEQLKADNWQDLIRLPPEWSTDTPDRTLDLVPTTERARELATIEILQIENRQLTQQLSALQAHETDLKLQIAQLRQDYRTHQQTIHSLELELSHTIGQVETLQAKLGAYSILSDQPVSLPVILTITLVAAVVLVLLIIAFSVLLL